MLFPGGEVDDDAAIQLERRHAVGDGLGRSGNSLADDAAQLFQHRAHGLGLSGDVAIDVCCVLFHPRRAFPQVSKRRILL
jgi:hypothetical protein